MARKKNLKIQLNEKLNGMLKIGTSRHAEKLKFGQNNVKTVHSISTAENYRQVINQFGDWLRENKSDIWKSKDINKISNEVISSYLKEREIKGLSAYTISRDIAALNKVLEKDITKHQVGLKNRSYKQIERSRSDKNKNLSSKILKKNELAIILAKAFGLRRHEILKVKKSDISLDHKSQIYQIKTIGKGGKFRQTIINSKYKEQLHKLLENKLENEILVNFYDNRIDNHAFRREYAQDRYVKLLKEFKEQKIYLGKDVKGFKSEVLKKVSNDLGHNRIDVVVYHYLI